jgi:hypothetical protein
VRHIDVMRYALLGTILLITAIDASAEHRPAATWEGEVNGTAVLIVQGDRIDVDTRSADLVSRTSYRFNTPLTADSGRITVENRQGGGRVRVIEQPSRNNHFSETTDVIATIRIEAKTATMAHEVEPTTESPVLLEKPTGPATWITKFSSC